MGQSSGGKYEPECPIAHDLVNKLSVIVGYCDLMMKTTPEDSPLLKQIQAVRSIARAMAGDLIKFQCELIRLRPAVRQQTANRSYRPNPNAVLWSGRQKLTRLPRCLLSVARALGQSAAVL